jgi:hypothetical protein
MFTDFYEIYDDFRDEFRYPKLHAHSGGGMASPRWVGLGCKLKILDFFKWG